MDNASKALLMAGGVLLAMIILATGLYLLSSYRGFARSVNENSKINTVESFNRYYDSFGNTITGIDVVNICNRVLNDRNNGYDINCNALSNGLYNSLDSITNVILQDEFSDSISQDNLNTLKSLNYSYTITNHDSQGYITDITIN